MPPKSVRSIRELIYWEYAKLVAGRAVGDLPRLVLGKYLKLVFEFHEEAGTLDAGDLNHDGTPNVYDLGAILTPGKSPHLP